MNRKSIFQKCKMSLLSVAMFFMALACFTTQAQTATFNLVTKTWSSGNDASNKCTWSGKILSIHDGANIAITGNLSAVSVFNVYIAVDADAKADITLNNVEIAVNGSVSALQLGAGSEVNLTVLGTSLLGSTAHPGIKTTGAKLTITAESTGVLSATNVTSANNSAGIGGAEFFDGGTIIINGGTIYATGYTGAGIGGGSYGSGGNITINGGTVIARSSGGATIGGGFYGSGGTITINSGTVDAQSAVYNAGIGGGSGGSGGNITINGGTVIAKSGGSGAGIGGGCFSNFLNPFSGEGGIITITGGTVTATSGGRGAAIGGAGNDNISGIAGDAGIITITGGIVNAINEGGGISIGGGCTTPTGSVGGSGGDIIIIGGTVTASAGVGAGKHTTTNVYGTLGTLTMNGNGVLYTSSIKANEDDVVNGITFVGTDDGVFYGTSVSPTDNFYIPAAKTLEMTGSQTLTIRPTVTLTNDGIIESVNAIINDGTIINNGEIITCAGIIGAGTITGNQITMLDTDWYTEHLGASSYEIHTACELAGLAQLVNSGNNFSGITITLAEDIDLSNYSTGTGWTPIGIYPGNYFRGTFDGDEHIIAGVIINASANHRGLFGFISSGATIKNLGITSANISGNSFVGGLTGEMGSNSTIENCFVTGTIHGNSSVGGIIGYVSGVMAVATVKNCYFFGAVSGNTNIGGIAGNVSGSTTVPRSSISNCYAVGTVECSGDYAGGIAGLVQTFEINNCAALNKSITGNNYVGRVVGSGSSLSGNYAWDGMTVKGSTVSSGGIHGDDITIPDIHNNVILNTLFLPPIWTLATHKLPGLFGKTVIMPAYLEGPPFDGGDGTEFNPYIITTETQLRWFQNAVNTSMPDFYAGYYYEKSFMLGADITLTGGAWTPVLGFQGLFNGNKQKISGINMNNPSLDYAGFIGTLLGDGTVKNLGVENVNIIGKDYVGGIIGQLEDAASVTNCYAMGNIVGRDAVGGVAGYINGNNCSVSNCYAAGDIGGVGGNNDMGGIVGRISASNSGSHSYITNCVALNCKITGNINLNRVLGNNANNRIISNNAAWNDMLINGSTVSSTNPASEHGADLKAKQILTDGSLGGRFLNDKNPWTTENGKLPGFGAAIAIPLCIVINAEAPVITIHPLSEIVSLDATGSKHNLNVTANSTDGGTLSYQWYSNTSAINTGGTLISGATGASYAAPIDATGTFYYYVVVTNTITNNGDGGNKTATTTGNAATLTVSDAFIPVTGITSLPTIAVTNTALTLSGTIVPANATNKTIVWSIKNAGTTGASVSGINGSTFNAIFKGTATVTATITNGLTETTDYTQDFDITVSYDGNYIDLSDNNPPATGIGWTYSNNVYTVMNYLNNKNVKVVGSREDGTRRIVVAGGAIVTMTFYDVKISGLPTGVGTYENACPFWCHGNSTVTAIFHGDNEFTGGHYAPAIRVEDASFTVSALSTGTLTVNAGVGAAALGGRDGCSWGSIYLRGGEITANSYGTGAAIGGGNALSASGYNPGNIYITGGKITAHCSGSGAGIGGGSCGNNGTVSITGGMVEAISTYGAGIGGGCGSGLYYAGGDGGTINITGGKVVANASGSAGIGGGGVGGKGGNITISGGTVLATSNSSGSAIGGGGEGVYISSGAGGNITISGGFVTATVTGSGSGIGRGGSTGSGPPPGAIGTFLMTGHGVVVTTSVSDDGASGKKSGILFNDKKSNNGDFYGKSVQPNENFTIPAGKTLTVPSGATFSIAAGITMTNYGTVIPADLSTVKVLGTVSTEGNKINGANVNGPPKENSKTAYSVTLNPSIIIAFTSQEVEYACNTINSVPASGWQTSLTFTGLAATTNYYFFARSKEDVNFKAGTASGSVTITTLAGVAKTVAVAAQNGTITTGSAGSVTFDVTTENIADGEVGTISWFTDLDGLTASSVPMGITPSVSNILTNVATVTMTAGITAVAGDYYFKVTIDGVTSGVVTLAISALPPVKTVAVDAQDGTITAGTGDFVTFNVTTENIADGQAGAISWFTAADGLTAGSIPTGITPSISNVLNDTAIVTMTANNTAMAGKYYFKVTIDGVTSDVVTLTISAPPSVKTVTVYAQNGTIIAGTAGSATFDITTVNIADGKTGTISWFTAADGLTACTVPTGITPSISNVLTDAATVTMIAGVTAVAGTYYFKVTIDGVTSDVVTFTTAPAPVKTVAVATQNGTITAGATGIATFYVTTANIADGESGTISWFTAADGLTAGSVPTGITPSFSNVLTDAATVTMIAGITTVAGNYYFKVTIDGVTSSVVRLKISDAATICPTNILYQGYNYEITQLAGLCWTENMRNRNYADNTPIQFAQPYFHSHNPDTTQYINDFGLLYSWYSAMGVLPPATPTVALQGICPDGWRIPTSAEWELLNMFDVNDLKNPAFWLQPNNNTNISGFDSRGAGFYNSEIDRFEQLYGYTAYWSSAPTCICACLHYYCNQIMFVNVKKSDAVSVRCVME